MAKLVTMEIQDRGTHGTRDLGRLSSLWRSRAGPLNAALDLPFSLNFKLLGLGFWRSSQANPKIVSMLLMECHSQAT